MAGLLEALQLKPTPSMMAFPPIRPQRVMDITDTQGAETMKDGALPIAVKVEPKDLKKRLDARDKALREAYAKLAKAQARLEDEIPKRNGDTKATMQAQKADGDKTLSNIDRQLAQLDKDRKAVGNPATDAKTMNDIAARAKSPEPIGKAVEVDKHDDPLEKSPLKKQTTTTTTEVKDGKSTTRVSDQTTEVGLDGVSRKNVESKETVTATGKTATTLSKSTTLGPDGYATETTKKRETESGDRKTSIEEKKGLKIGPDGVASSSERTVTQADGSAKTDKKTSGVERGDGKLGGTTTTTRERTDADGNTTTSSATGKGGLVAGKDGIGGYGEGQGSVERKSKGGLTTGAVGGLNANVVCNVKEVPGSDPPVYMLSTTISLGASIKGAVGKEGESGAKAGVSVSGSATVTMSASHRLSEAEAAVYVAALKTGSGSQREMAIIRTGLTDGWPAAQRAYLAMSGQLGTAADVDSMQAGETKTVGRKTTGGGGINADVKGFGIEVGVEKSGEREMTVTKEDDGSAAYDTKQGESDKGTLGGSVSMGVVEGGASYGQTVTTSTGYKFRVKPDMKNARQLQDQIAGLANASQAEVDAFAKAHPECVVSRVDVRDDSDQTKVTAGIGGVKGTLMSGSGVEDTVTRDKDGKIIDTKKRGHNEGGMTVSAGGLTIASSTEEQAMARDGADGERVVDVTRTDTGTDAAKFLDALPLIGTKKKDKGALATATGAEDEEDTSTRSIKGRTLKVADLKMLAGKANNEADWMSSCPSPSHRKDWLKAAKEIRDNGGTEKAVADALARFIGGDNLRQKVVDSAVRGEAGDVKAASAWEFPDSIAARQADYVELVLTASEKLVAKAAEGGDKAKAEALARNYLGRLDSLVIAIRSASDFEQLDVRGEMLSAIANRKSKIEIEVRKLSGVDQATAEKDQERADFDLLLDACVLHQQEEEQLFDKIDLENKERYSKHAAAINIVTLVNQIKNLHSTWRKDYEKMAMLAQEHGWAKDRYHRFKPDTARLQHAEKTSTAGTASKPTTEKKNFKRDPNAVSQEREFEMHRDVSKSETEQFNAIKAGAERAYSEARALVNELHAVLEKAPYPTVKQFFDQGYALYKDGEANMRQCRGGNHMQEMFDYGLAAWEQFKQALPLLKRAKGFIPKKA